MSTFAVTIEEIAKVWVHPNADRLSMAQLASMTFQFVILKDQFQPGERVVYFPIDSLLPAPLIETLGLTGKLSGKDKNRVKTVRLRDQISQGVVAAPHSILPPGDYHPGQDVTDLLGVTKYEPPIVPIANGKLVRLPQMVSVYDIEGAERYADIAESLLDTPVIITEKLEGSHFAASLLPDGDIAVSQRNYRIEPLPGLPHDWHKAAETSGIKAALPALKTLLETALGHPVQTVTVRGEMLGPGIQKNIYGLKDHRVRVFDIEADGRAVDAPLYLEAVTRFQLEHAPILAQDVTLRAWLDGRSVAEASNGLSQLKPDVLREGVVIRPMQEGQEGRLGRVILKQRSPEYLAQSDF